MTSTFSNFVLQDLRPSQAWRQGGPAARSEPGGGSNPEYETYKTSARKAKYVSDVKGRAEAAAPKGGPGEHGAQRSLDAPGRKQAPATPGGEGLILPPGMPPGEGGF